MTLPSSCATSHNDFAMPPEDASRFQEPGLTIDVEAIGTLVAAAFDNCQKCQDDLLDRIEKDPVTTVRMVELAAVTIHGELGGIPSSMLTADAGGYQGVAPSTLSDPFRQLVTAGLDEQHVAMLAAARALTTEQRRQAAEDALDLVTGGLVIASHEATREPR